MLQKNRTRWRSDVEYRETCKNNLKKNRQQRREWLEQYKSNKTCVACGENDPCCLDFHHRDPSSKEGLISRMVGSAASLDRILNEIDKCDIVCSNCHRKIHAGKLKL